MNFRSRAWQSFFHRWTVSDFYWAQDQAIAAERQRFVAQLELGAFSIWVPRDWRPNSEKLTFQDLEGGGGLFLWVPWVSTRNPIDTLKFIETAVQSINSSCFKEGVFFFSQCYTNWYVTTRLSCCIPLSKPPIYLPGHHQCRLHGWWWGCHHLEHWRQWLWPLKAVATKTHSPAGRC